MATVRTNQLHLTVGNGATIKFTPNTAADEHKISDGQPWESIKWKSTGGYIEVKAGRKKTDAVADWFDDKVESDTDKMLVTKNISDIEPKELNFAFTGILTIKRQGTDSYPVTFGQGSYKKDGKNHNNWWIAGTDIYQTESKTHIGSSLRIEGQGHSRFKLFFG